jgi:hypothetical protein
MSAGVDKPVSGVVELFERSHDLSRAERRGLTGLADRRRHG